MNQIRKKKRSTDNVNMSLSFNVMEKDEKNQIRSSSHLRIIGHEFTDVS